MRWLSKVRILCQFGRDLVGRSSLRSMGSSNGRVPRARAPVIGWARVSRLSPVCSRPDGSGAVGGVPLLMWMKSLLHRPTTRMASRSSHCLAPPGCVQDLLRGSRRRRNSFNRLPAAIKAYCRPHRTFWLPSRRSRRRAAAATAWRGKRTTRAPVDTSTATTECPRVGTRPSRNG